MLSRRERASICSRKCRFRFWINFFSIAFGRHGKRWKFFLYIIDPAQSGIEKRRKISVKWWSESGQMEGERDEPEGRSNNVKKKISKENCCHLIKIPYQIHNRCSSWYFFFISLECQSSRLIPQYSRAQRYHSLLLCVENEKSFDDKTEKNEWERLEWVFNLNSHVMLMPQLVSEIRILQIIFSYQFYTQCWHGGWWSCCWQHQRRKSTT